MSDEQAMEIIENLSEELGEKELTIMKLEKSLEEQTKVLRKMTELCEIKQYKIDFMEDHGDNTFCPSWIIGNNAEEDDELMIKVVLHYFGGKIMHQSDIIKEYGDIDFDEEGAIPGVDIEDLDNDTGNFWVCER
jgi:hypothetical protein